VSNIACVVDDRSDYSGGTQYSDLQQECSQQAKDPPAALSKSGQMELAQPGSNINNLNKTYVVDHINITEGYNGFNWTQLVEKQYTRRMYVIPSSIPSSSVPVLFVS
jgi:hypothetical protein